MDVVIYHNPKCGTSRNVLGLIRKAGIEPKVVDYLKTPPGRAELQALAKRMGVPLRAILRETGTPFKELGLDRADVTDNEILDAIEKHPILINRPIVTSDKGAKLCRPADLVLGLLP